MDFWQQSASISPRDETRQLIMECFHTLRGWCWNELADLIWPRAANEWRSGWRNRYCNGRQLERDIGGDREKLAVRNREGIGRDGTEGTGVNGNRKAESLCYRPIYTYIYIRSAKGDLQIHDTVNTWDIKDKLLYKCRDRGRVKKTGNKHDLTFIPLPPPQWMIYILIDNMAYHTFPGITGSPQGKGILNCIYFF